MNNSNDNINRIIHLMQTDNSVDAPADAITWSKNLFKTRSFEQKTSIVEKIKAVLQMDLQPGKAVFGERSATANQARQMLFGTEQTSIDLRIEQTEESFLIKGQILGENFENAAITLGEIETKANDLSEFKLENVSSGTYDLVIRTDEKEIVLENIEIK